MPVDMPTPIAALGQSLQDGIPLVVVTRGCFGRQLDYGARARRREVCRLGTWRRGAQAGLFPREGIAFGPGRGR